MAAEGAAVFRVSARAGGRLVAQAKERLFGAPSGARDGVAELTLSGLGDAAQAVVQLGQTLQRHGAAHVTAIRTSQEKQGPCLSVTVRREDDVARQTIVTPYGWLGMQMAAEMQKLPDGKQAPIMRRNAEEPDSRTAFVDPAGLHHIHGKGKDGPAGAGGAAGQIYKYIGLADQDEFPLEVQKAITETSQAKYHRYSEQHHVIHVVGPDLRTEKDEEVDGKKTGKKVPIMVTKDGKEVPKPKPTRPEAVGALAEAYKNVFAEFCQTKLQRLRLLPISGGIFLGDFRPEIEQVTVESLRRGFEMLTEAERRRLRQREVEMCIFMEKEYEGFRRAFGQA